MTVMLQEEPPIKPALAVAFGIILGAGIQWFLLRLDEDGSPRGRSGGFLHRHAPAVETFAGLSAATGAAIVGVYITQYESNPAWAARPGEVVALVSGAIAAAGAAYATTASLVRMKMRPNPQRAAQGASSSRTAE